MVSRGRKTRIPSCEERDARSTPSSLVSEPCLPLKLHSVLTGHTWRGENEGSQLEKGHTVMTNNVKDTSAHKAFEPHH